MCKRGDIYYVDFGQNIDSNKQCGIRPAVIVSNNRANEHSPVITVVPLTSRTYKKRSLPTHVFIQNGAVWRRTVWLWLNRWKRLIKRICEKSVDRLRTRRLWSVSPRQSRYKSVWMTDIIKIGS